MKLQLIDSNRLRLTEGIFGKVRELMRKVHLNNNLLNTHFDVLDGISESRNYKTRFR